ncbi:MAG: Rieske 2Fe-2S domain-containing protein [Actinobacteria bacterium]|nr:Rieske 2Fe-2S domain-containing protein [Actinomycetota bacterium]
MASTDESLQWHHVADARDVEPGRVKTVVAGHKSLCLANVDGTFGALDNHCPHQGGPLGEGSIENGWLRCPWHGYDYDPLTGQPPGAFSDAPECFTTELRGTEVWVALRAEVPAERTVSDVLVETMTNWGVTHVFGMVGHSNLGFADAMRRAEERGDLTFIGIRHEGAAAFAATAYGKLTGIPGGCFGIAGPGSTNLLTGLYDAKVDRAPVLALCGQVPSKNKGRGAFQDMDLEAAFADVAAFSESVHSTADPAELMTLACKTAIIERDVAHLVLPDEVQPMVVHANTPAGSPTGRVGSRAIAPDAEVLEAAVAMIAAARRPLIIVGAGAREAKHNIISLAEQIGAPVVTTFKAKGQISDHHPLGCGVLGRSGTPIASWFMNECDLVVAFGTSFSNHTGIAAYKPIVQIDQDPMALGRFHPVELPVQGDCGVTAGLLSTALDHADTQGVDLRDEVAQRWSIWRDEKASRVTDNEGHGIGSAAVMAALGRVVPSDAVMPVDLGNNTYAFGRYFEVTDQTVLMSGYLGSIGFGFPAAMGSWAALQAQGSSRKVVSVSGDGGFGQYAMELTTAVKYDMDITHVLLTNNELGKISKEQRAVDYDVWQTSLHNPNFAEFAQLCGAKGIRVTDQANLDDAIAEAIAHPGPALVEIMTDALLV